MMTRAFLISSFVIFNVSAHAAHAAEGINPACLHSLFDLGGQAGEPFWGPTPEEKAQLQHHLRTTRQALAGQIEYHDGQEARPPEFRDEQDPRWFQWIRGGDRTNPVRLRHVNQAKEYRARQTQINESITLMDQVETLQSELAKKQGPFDSVILKWLRHRSIEVGIEVLEATRVEQTNPIPENEAAETLRGELEQLSEYLSSSQTQNPLVKTILEAALEEALEELQNGIADAYPSKLAKTQLLNVAQQHSLSVTEVAQRFLETDKALQTHANRKIDSEYVALLVETSVRHEAPSEKVAEAFFRLDAMGAETKSGFQVHDREVVVLVDLAFETGVTVEGVNDTFFELEKLGRETRPSFHFNDASIVALSYLVLKHQKAPLEVANRFFEAHDAADAKDLRWGNQDLAVALSVELSLQGEMTPEQAINQVIALQNAFKESELAEVDGSAAVRVALFAQRNERNAETLAEDWKKVVELSDETDAFRVMTVLELSYRESNGSHPSETQIQSNAIPPRLRITKVRDSLSDPSARSSSYSSSSYSSSSDNGFGFGSTPTIGDMLGTGIPGGIDMDFSTPF